jgi:predicted dehydrogenase
MANTLLKKCVSMGQRVVAVYDPDAEAVARAREDYGAEAASSAEDLCGRADVNAVLVASPPAYHIEGVLAAAAAGKPVYCEKPLATNVADCDRMIRACDEAGTPLFVGQVLRLFPLFWQSRVLIDAGRIGTPRAVRVTRTSFARFFGQGWRSRRAEAGGLLLEIHVHELDYMRFLLGEPVEVYARMDNLIGQMDYEDQAFVIVTFENGAVGSLHASMSSPIGEYNVSIQGTGGNIVHGGFGGILRVQGVGGETEEYKPEDVGVPDAYDRELRSWIDSLTVGTEPIFTGADGRACVAMAQAARLSADLNRPVAIAELG